MQRSRVALIHGLSYYDYDSRTHYGPRIHNTKVRDYFRVFVRN